VSLRTDDRQWLIYDPNTVSLVFKALEASSLVMFGGWLQRRAGSLPEALSGNVGTTGAILSKMGGARQEIHAGLAPNDVPDALVEVQRGLDLFIRWLNDPSSVPFDVVVDIMDQIAAAMAYMDQRTYDTGTNHPRWNSRLVSGDPCGECGR
jgi:hypothetical protein